jgi:hypothetical protein
MGDCLRRINRRGRGQEKILKGEEDQSVFHIRHVFGGFMNPPNTEKEARKWEGNGNIMEEVNLFKVHYAHVGNYSNEIPLYL